MKGKKSIPIFICRSCSQPTANSVDRQCILCKLKELRGVKRPMVAFLDKTIMIEPE